MWVWRLNSTIWTFASIFEAHSLYYFNQTWVLLELNIIMLIKCGTHKAKQMIEDTRQHGRQASTTPVQHRLPLLVNYSIHYVFWTLPSPIQRYTISLHDHSFPCFAWMPWHFISFLQVCLGLLHILLHRAMTSVCQQSWVNSRRFTGTISSTRAKLG